MDMSRWQGRERPFKVVPFCAWLVLGLGIGAQTAFHWWDEQHRVAQAKPLPLPPPVTWLRVAGLGDSIVVSKLTMLWLQAFDNQPGVSLPLHVLDYERVEAWLGAALDLDPGSHYPLLVATRLYGSVADRGRVRRMLEFAYDRFLQAPNHRWRWLAHASILAKHRLGDLPLALRYARAITTHATGPQVPYWARDLTVIVLAEMGEYEAARGLVAALLAGGEIRDAHELRFLEAKLAEIDALSKAAGTSSNPPAPGH